jgi:periplasmic protein TonB
MFSELDRSSSKGRRALAASLGIHGLIFAWLLHSPEPRLLQPQSVALGHNGRVISKLYFPSQNLNDATNSADNAHEVYRHQRLGHEKLAWQRSTSAKLLAPRTLSPATEDKSETATFSKGGHGAAAGPLYGSVPGGPIYGDEIRPALPIATSDPVVYPWERPDQEGKVIIEITIDETGAIVRKTVLQSMGSDIDGKCLAALEKWRFQPAMHNGTPIASKQDAIFPFKPRGVSSVRVSSPIYPAIMEM